MSAEHALAQLRHLYTQLLFGYVEPQKDAARYLLGPAIEELEHAERAQATALREAREEGRKELWEMVERYDHAARTVMERPLAELHEQVADEIRAILTSSLQSDAIRESRKFPPQREPAPCLCAFAAGMSAADSMRPGPPHDQRCARFVPAEPQGTP